MKIEVKKINPVKLFTVLILFFYCLHFILFLLNPNGIQRNLYFRGFEDLFADFFNSCILVSDRNPYFSNYFFQSNYLPFTNLIFYPFARLAGCCGMSLSDCYTNKITLFTCFYFILLNMLFFIHSLICFCKKCNTDTIILLPICFSSIILVTLERANLIFMSIACILYFLSFYDSNIKFYRYFAATALVFSAVIKVYPVLFGILYLEKKYLKEILYCFLLGIFLTFVPFLFFKNGFANIFQLLKILSGTVLDNNSDVLRFDFSYIVFNLCNIFSLSNFSIKLARVTKYITYFMIVFSLITAYFEKDFLKKLFFIIFSILYIPVFSYYYCAVYFIPFIVLFFSKKITKNLYPVFILILLLYLPFNFFNRVLKMGVFVNAICFFLWIIFFLSEIVFYIQKRTLISEKSK